MNGIHDMGGLHGFGPVEVEKNEPVFHSLWESRVYAMTQVLDTKEIYSLDEHRHEIELMDTPSYLTAGYYGRWLFAMERILDRLGILRQHEVDERVTAIEHDARSFHLPAKTGRNWPLADRDRVHWGAWRKDVTVMPKFRKGDRVRVRNLHPPGHTRLTAYVRGKTGIVEIVNDQAWVFPDTRAHRRGEKLQPVYNVRFAAAELWGDQAEPNVFVNADLCEDYLEST
jgi:nitrile hydratase subunit beta